MAWANPRTWTPGELVTALMMNQHVRDNLNYLKTEHSAGQMFRGLQLRTHPDLDLAVSKVMLVKADEIVMHDGARVADWSALVADITVAGAGGLDTGVEQASTWYEILAIRNSSSGAKSLMFHRAKDWFLDQSLTSIDNKRALRVLTSTPTDKIAQGFQVATAGLVEFADIALDRDGVPTGKIWLTIETDSGGNPSGTVLATSDKMNTANVPDSGNGTPIRFLFRTPPTLAIGTQYHLVLQGDYARSDTVWVAWSGLVAGGYANGVSKDFNGTTWSATPSINGVDRYFRIYVTRNDAAVVMPAGYDQRARVGWVYNGAGSNFTPFVAVDRDVWTDLSDSGAVTTQSAVLVLANTFIPPTRVVMKAGAHSSVANNFALAGGVPDGYIAGSVFGAVNKISDSGLEFPLGEFPTDTQAYYASLNSGTGNIQIRSKGYRW